jgi:hypothetical protein
LWRVDEMKENLEQHLYGRVKDLYDNVHQSGFENELSKSVSLKMICLEE